MSSLRDRLKRLTGAGAGAGGASGTEDGSTAGEAIGSNEPLSAEIDVIQPAAREAASKHGAAYSIESLDEEWRKLDAELVRNEWGSFIRRRRLYPPEHHHGEYRLADLHGCAGELASFYGEAEAGTGIQSGDLLFFDTETTGLGIGAGNVPFMIGIGFWEAEGFAVEQLFIRNPAEELAMLAYLSPFMERYPYWVSYNGRSFDWPLLQNRFVMNRMSDRVTQPKHLDFLYPSRSLWRNTLPSCRLGKVEEARLGFTRIDDVPGSMAPTLYFLYLAEKKPGAVGPVFLHNELDILSLAGLAVLFARTLTDGQYGTGPQHPEERFRLGLWLHKMGKHELSRRVLKELHAEPSEASAVMEYARALYIPLAAHYKQIGAWQDAVELWQRAIRADNENAVLAGPSLEPYVELSMHYEHRVKDYAAALSYAEEALDWAERRRSALQSVLWRNNRLESRKRAALWGEGPAGTTQGHKTEGGREGIGELEKRVRRLRNKLLKASGRGARSAAPDGSVQPEAPVRRSGKRSCSVSAPESFTLF